MHISIIIYTTELRDREMKERDLPIWDKETTICELERVWANRERESTSFQRKKRREPPLVVVVAVLAISRGGRPWRLKELWEFWKREEGLRFRREGNWFEGFLLSVRKIFGFGCQENTWKKKKKKRKTKKREENKD